MVRDLLLLLILESTASLSASAQGVAATTDTAITFERRIATDMVRSTIRADVLTSGQVYRVGSGSVAERGRGGRRFALADTLRLGADSVAALLAEFENLGFMDLEASYATAPQCLTRASHVPFDELTLRVDGMTKTVRYDHGCEEAPAKLRALVARLETALGLREWMPSLRD